MNQPSPKPKSKKWPVVCSFILGVAAMFGVGFGMKATDQASFCAKCHTMAEAAWTHKMSVHAKLDCNECHTPYNLVEKLPFKTASGVKDIYANNFEAIADVIHATESTKDVVQANCRRCHASTISQVAMDVKPYCTDCHKAVPHMKKLPIDRRAAADV